MTHRSAREAAEEMRRWRAARKAAKKARVRASADMLAAVQRLQAFVRDRKSNALLARWRELSAELAAEVTRVAEVAALREAVAAREAKAAERELERAVVELQERVELRPARLAAVATVLLTCATVCDGREIIRLRGGADRDNASDENARVEDAKNPNRSPAAAVRSRREERTVVNLGEDNAVADIDTRGERTGNGKATVSGAALALGRLGSTASQLATLRARESTLAEKGKYRSATAIAAEAPVGAADVGSMPRREAFPSGHAGTALHEAALAQWCESNMGKGLKQRRTAAAYEKRVGLFNDWARHAGYESFCELGCSGGGGVREGARDKV